MPLIAIGLLAGMLTAAHLPAPLPGWAVVGSSAAAATAWWAGPWLRPVAAALLGAAWFSVAASWQLADRLPAAEDRREVAADFLIDDFPRRRGRALTFTARPLDPALPRRVRLNWYEAGKIPRIGERWQLTVVLRSPRGLVNPGGFDYERWLFTKGIGATGYVRGAGRLLARPGPGSVAWWRDRLDRTIAGVLPEGPGRGVIVALVTGSRHRLASDAIRTFQTTGTSHLMAISGLHIALVAGLVYLLASRLPAVLARVAVSRDRAALLAFVAALAYGLIAGFGTPVRRALLMLATLTLAGLWRRPVAPASGLALAMIVVLAVQPLDCLTPGFALSFGAVAAILAIAGADRSAAAPRRTGMAMAVALQARLCLLLLPLTLAYFDRIAWAAIPANLLAIPAFGVAIVPGALLGGMLALVAETPASWVLSVTHAALGLLLKTLSWLASVPGADYRPAGTGPLVALALSAAAGTLLLPARLPGRRLPVWLALLLFVPRAPPVPAGCFVADILDVGQGLAAIVRTRHHTLLYDAGPGYASGADAGERVVVPALRMLGVRSLDLMVLSHADADHAGGASSVRDAIPVAGVRSGEPGELESVQASSCQRGQRWIWDGVEFQILWPDAAGGSGNDRSCVLAVDAGRRRLLLTGDIERRSEQRLVVAGGLGPADVVVMPHHGSATSSSTVFVDALHPAIAIATAAWRNRWHFPRPDVVARWQTAGAQVISTGDTGAVSITLCRREQGRRVDLLRDSRRRIWSPPPAEGSSGMSPL